MKLKDQAMHSKWSRERTASVGPTQSATTDVGCSGILSDLLEYIPKPWKGLLGNEKWEANA